MKKLSLSHYFNKCFRMFGLFFECSDKLKIKNLREGCLELWKIVNIQKNNETPSLKKSD